MEAVTAIFWGPLCLVLAGFIVADHPLRHSLQTIVSLGQLYGDVLYYATCAHEHIVQSVTYTRPENFYFWGYFVFLNAIWIVVPSSLLVQSARATTSAFSRIKAEDLERKSS